MKRIQWLARIEKCWDSHGKHLAWVLAAVSAGCGSTGTVTSATTSASTAASSSSFSVSASLTSIDAGESTTLTAENGTAPYSYFVLTDGYGSINSSTGVFTASSGVSSGTVAFEATDSAGHTATTSITIVGTSTTTSTTALSLSASSSSITSGSAVTFTASGGVSPYTYSIVQGAGSLSISGSSTSNTTVYTSSSSESGAIEIEVEDSDGSVASASVTVTSAVVNSTSLATAFNLLTDDMIGITLYNPSSNSYPELVIFGTGSKPNEPSMLAHTAYETCGADSSGNALSPCAVTVALSNFQNSDPGTTAYEGTVSFAGRSGSGSISFCINPNDSTTTAYVLAGAMSGSATLTQFLTMSYDDTQAGRKLLDGTEVTSFYSEVDTNSGTGYAYVYVSGAYSTATTCSGYGSGTIYSAAQ